MDWDGVEDKIIWGERKSKEDSIESINSMELESLRIKTCMLLEWQLSWNMRENDQEIAMRSMDYTYFTFSPKNLDHLKETTTRDYSDNL